MKLYELLFEENTRTARDIYDDLERSGRIMFHASPVKITLNDLRSNSKDTAGLEELYNALDNATEEEQRIIDFTIRQFKKGFGNMGGKEPGQIYVTSKPEEWEAVAEDELEITYKYGGIYAFILKIGVKEYWQPSGMGMQLPEAKTKISNILKMFGPYKTKEDAIQDIFSYIKEKGEL